MLNDFSIEAGAVNDVDELEMLYDDLNDYLETGVNYSGWLKGIYPVRREAEAGVRDGNLFVLRAGGKIAGSVILNHNQEDAYKQVAWGVDAADGEVIVIHTLVVHPNFLKRGVGEKLMGFAKDYSLQNQMKTIRLDVAVQNSPAIALYEKCGYKYVGTVDLGLEHEHLKWFKLFELAL